MKNQQKRIKKYTNSVARKLNMPKELRTRIISDFVSSIQGRREAGQSDSQIFAELGSPKKVAAELNEQMRDYTFVKSPWRWVCLAVVIVCIVSLTFGGTVGLITYLFNASVSHSVGIIGGADGPTSVFVATSPDFFWYKLGFTLLVLIAGIWGFYRLSRCPRK